jgi:hypothetical protein
MTTHPGHLTRWRKSSHSGSGNNCVEVATLGSGIAIRDSKDPDSPHLIFTFREWRTFTTSIKSRFASQD